MGVKYTGVVPDKYPVLGEKTTPPVDRGDINPNEVPYLPEDWKPFPSKGTVQPMSRESIEASVRGPRSRESIFHGSTRYFDVLEPRSQFKHLVGDLRGPNLNPEYGKSPLSYVTTNYDEAADYSRGRAGQRAGGERFSPIYELENNNALKSVRGMIGLSNSDSPIRKKINQYSATYVTQEPLKVKHIAGWAENPNTSYMSPQFIAINNAIFGMSGAWEDRNWHKEGKE